MRIRLIRHATLVLEVAGARILVDPMLGAPGSAPPVPDTPEPRPNPLVPLPVPAEEVVAGISAAAVTHLHGDHLDQAGAALLPRDRPVLCQPRDEAHLARCGLQALSVPERLDFGTLAVARTSGRHGTGAIGQEMGEVSGFVISAPGEPTAYIAGDTIWCEEVEAAIAVHRPDVIVVNSGAARFVAGDPITMSAADVAEVARAAPDALVIAVHMEAMNHCLLTRTGLRDALRETGLDDRVAIPADGETLQLELGGA